MMEVLIKAWAKRLRKNIKSEWQTSFHRTYDISWPHFFLFQTLLFSDLRTWFVLHIGMFRNVLHIRSFKQFIVEIRKLQHCWNAMSLKQLQPHSPFLWDNKPFWKVGARLGMRIIFMVFGVQGRNVLPSFRLFSTHSPPPPPLSSLSLFDLEWKSKSTIYYVQTKVVFKM